MFKKTEETLGDSSSRKIATLQVQHALQTIQRRFKLTIIIAGLAR